MLGAAVASCLPFVACGQFEMWAMSRERPAIVKRPNNADVMLLYVAKKKGDVDVRIVQIVNMNNFWRNFGNPSQKANC